MNPWYYRLLCVVSIALALSLTGASRAQDKKDTKAKDDKIIVIQIDASKLPPGVLKNLLELSKNPGKDDEKTDKKVVVKKEAEKKPVSKKEEAKKEDSKKSNIVQVDLNKLSPDLAKRLSAELSKSSGKDDSKGKAKKDDDDDDKGSKGKAKKDNDDDDDKGSKGKKDDDKKGGKKKDD